MKTSDVLAHFRTQTAIADALCIEQSSVANWGEFPPPLRQLQIEELTARRLVAEPTTRPWLLSPCED